MSAERNGITAEARLWHLDKLHQSCNARVKSAGVALLLYMLLISLTALIIVSNAELVKVPFVPFEIPRLPAAGIGLVLACAALFRFALLGRSLSEARTQFHALRKAHFEVDDDYVKARLLVQSTVMNAIMDLTKESGGWAKRIGLLTMAVVMGLFILAAPLACMCFLAIWANLGWLWWGVAVPSLALFVAAVVLLADAGGD